MVEALVDFPLTTCLSRVIASFRTWRIHVPHCCRWHRLLFRDLIKLGPFSWSPVIRNQFILLRSLFHVAPGRKLEHLDPFFRFIFWGFALLGHAVLDVLSYQFWIQFCVSVSRLLFGFCLAHRLRKNILFIGYCYNIVLLLDFLGPSSMFVIGLLLEVTSLTHFVLRSFLSKAQPVKFSLLHLLLLVYNIQNFSLICALRKILVAVGIIILHWILKSSSRQPQIRLKSWLFEKIPFCVVFRVLDRRFDLWLFQTDDSSLNFNIRFLFYTRFCLTSYICILKTFERCRRFLVYWVFSDDMLLISIIFCLSDGDRKPIIFLRVLTDGHTICARSYSKLWYVSNFNIDFVAVVIILTPRFILVLILLMCLFRLLFARSFICFWWGCWIVVIVARLIGISQTIRVVSQMSCRLYTTHANLIYIVSLIHYKYIKIIFTKKA